MSLSSYHQKLIEQYNSIVLDFFDHCYNTYTTANCRQLLNESSQSWAAIFLKSSVRPSYTTFT